MKVSETFCPLPFVHQYVAINGDKTPCCYACHGVQGTKSDTPTQSFNSSGMKRIRMAMLEGKRNNTCKICYQMEDDGIASPRQTFLKNWTSKDSFESVLDEQIELAKKSQELELKSVDIRFSNTCSLKCRTCNSSSSSAIFAETRTYENIPTIIKDEYFFNIKEELNQNSVDDMPVSKNLKWLNLVGGEPLVESKNVEYLEKLAAVGAQPQIIINTSFAKKNNKLLDVSKHFEHMYFMVSIDGVGKYNDYIRNGSKFDEVVEHMSVYEQIQVCGINTVASMYNIFHIPAIIRWVSENFQNRLPDFHNISLTMNHAPTEIQNLPYLFRKQVIDELEEIFEEYQNPYVNNIIAELQKDNYREENFQKFIAYTKFMDEKRGENILAVEPRYAPYFA